MQIIAQRVKVLAQSVIGNLGKKRTTDSTSDSSNHRAPERPCSASLKGSLHDCSLS